MQKTHFHPYLGRALRNLRLEMGHTHDSLARECTTDVKTISKIERDVQQGTHNTYFDLCRGLGIRYSRLTRLAEQLYHEDEQNRR